MASSSSRAQKGKQVMEAPMEEPEPVLELTKMKGRKLHMERGLAFEDMVVQYLHDYKWEKLAGHPPTANKGMVWDFYTALQKASSQPLEVRGVSVRMSEKIINAHYGLVKENGKLAYSNFFNKAASRASAQEMDRILSLPDTRSYNEGEKKFQYAKWNPLARTWLYFVSARLMPSTHFTLITPERAVLVYAILTGHGLNVGHIMMTVMTDISQSHRHDVILPFPSLITEICTAAGVPEKNGDQLIDATCPIRYNRFHLQVYPAQTERPGKKTSRAQETPTSRFDALEERLDGFDARLAGMQGDIHSLKSTLEQFMAHYPPPPP